MEDARNFANIERRLHGGDGQSLQQFMSDSPWSKQAVCDQIQDEIGAHPALQHGGLLILDESSDETAGEESAGAGRQHNGRLGKVELSVTTVGLAYAHPATGTWVLIDGELFLQEVWFTEAYADRRKAVGLPPERTFATKPELGLQMIRRAQAGGLPFDLVACDDLYGKSREFRAALDRAQIPYAAEVPGTTQVYLQGPKVGVPRRRHKRGKPPTRLQVRSRQVPHEVRALARSGLTTWERVAVRNTERGELIADFAVRPVWTLTESMQVRREWLVTRRDDDGRLTYVLLNAPDTTPAQILIEQSCCRYFTERTYQDAKSELGWADLQARKYRAWEHTCPTARCGSHGADRRRYLVRGRGEIGVARSLRPRPATGAPVRSGNPACALDGERSRFVAGGLASPAAHAAAGPRHGRYPFGQSRAVDCQSFENSTFSRGFGLI